MLPIPHPAAGPNHGDPLPSAGASRRHPSRAPRLRIALAALALLPLIGCDGEEAAGPDARYTVDVRDGDGQFAAFGEPLADPLSVVVRDATTDDPVPGVTVRWSLLRGDGALVTATSVTDGDGLASNQLTVGSTPTHEVEADVQGRVGQAARFAATAVAAAMLDSIVPARAAPGDTVLVYGSDFSADPALNSVLFDGLRATVLDVTAGRLRVVVPACMPSRTASVLVRFGAVAGNALPFTVEPGVVATGLAPAPGEAVTLTDLSALACLRLDAAADAEYLLVLHNAGSLTGTSSPLELTGLVPGAITSPPARTAASRASARFDDAWEAALRERERVAVDRGVPLQAAGPGMLAPPVPPQVGDRRDFWVYAGSGNQFERVTAEVRHVSQHAVLYQDVDAPAGGFTAAQFQQFGALFDDPVHSTMVPVYGQPSDLDGNQRVIVLFTPVVNRLTPRNSGGSFVAGFFYGIDLLDHEKGNDGEIFYTLVPDPQGEFGDVRTFDQMIAAVPPVLAHEFLHMVHFNERVLVRGVGLEAPWLSEGLAHTAEELVGLELTDRGDDEAAFDFRIQNMLRLGAYLDAPEQFSALGPDTPLPVRGAVWSMLEYLEGQGGGTQLLTDITRSGTSGIANLTSATGLSWTEIVSRWGTALWADDSGITGIDPIYEIADVNLRALFGGSFPLRPEAVPLADFVRNATVGAGSAAYLMLEAGPAGGPIGLGFTRRYGAAFTTGEAPSLTILRVQ